MGNCNCCEEDPPATVTTISPHQTSPPVAFNHHIPETTSYPTAPPPPFYEPPPPTMYPPLPPQDLPYAQTPVSTGPSYYWTASSHGGIPPMAVKAGVDKSGEDIFVGRAYHEGDALPAKVVASHRCAYVAWGGQEHSKDHYDVLCAQSVSWHSGRHGEVPDNALSCGQTADGETLFVGRVLHDGTLTPGKVHPSHGVIYIPYAGAEMSFQEYEVLVAH